MKYLPNGFVVRKIRKCVVCKLEYTEEFLMGLLYIFNWIPKQNESLIKPLSITNDLRMTRLGGTWTRAVIFSVPFYGTVSFYSGINMKKVPIRNINYHEDALSFTIDIKRILLIEFETVLESSSTSEREALDSK